MCEQSDLRVVSVWLFYFIKAKVFAGDLPIEMQRATTPRVVWKEAQMCIGFGPTFCSLFTMLFIGLWFRIKLFPCPSAPCFFLRIDFLFTENPSNRSIVLQY